jgi:hypothetical protein
LGRLFVQTATFRFEFNLPQVLVTCFWVRQPFEQLGVEDLRPDVAESGYTVVVALSEVEGDAVVEDVGVGNLILFKVL